MNTLILIATETNGEETGKRSAEGRNERNATLKELKKGNGRYADTANRIEQRSSRKTGGQVGAKLTHMPKKANESAKDDRIERSNSPKTFSQTHTQHSAP